MKSTSRAENVYARLEADRAGADDALLLTLAGDVCEGTSANVFAIRGERLVTPPLSSGCLAGTTRAWLLAHAATHGLATVEEPLTPASLARPRTRSSSPAASPASCRSRASTASRSGAACPGPFTVLLRQAREAWIDRVSLGRG